MRIVCQNSGKEFTVGSSLNWILVRACVLAVLSWIATPHVSWSQTVSEPYHIGAWYFTLWGQQAAGSMQALQAQQEYGGPPDPWGGVREYSNGEGIVPTNAPDFGIPTTYASRKPLLGFYDLTSQNVVDSEIEEAASEGLEFFSIYWYADSQTGQEYPSSSVVEKFFNSHVNTHFKFVLAPIVLGSSPTMTLSTWEGTIVPKLVSYIQSGAYYRVNGRPLIVAFTLPFASASDGQAGYAYFRQAVTQATGQNPLIIDLLGADNTWNDMEFQRAAVDGFTCFGAPINGTPEPYQQYTAAFVPWMMSQLTSPNGSIDPTLLYMPCGSLGQDARPWWQIGWGNWDYPTPASRPYNTGVSASLWRQHLLQMKAVIDQRRFSTLNTVFLYAWNEWGESAQQIEPSQTAGYTYADVVRQVFGLVPLGPKPPQ